MDPSFVLRRGKVTIKLQLTFGTWTSLPWNPSLQHQSLLHLWAAGYSFPRSTCMCWIRFIWWIKSPDNPVGSGWKQRALLPGPAFAPSNCNSSEQSPWGKKNQFQWKKKNIGNSCREYLQRGKMLSSCIKTCAAHVCTVQQKALHLGRMEKQSKSRWGWN